jgi:hypothetical protein
VKLGSNANEMKTQMLTGAIACAIVGAVENGSAGSGGSNVGQSLLGSGFQFPAAASYGYIEFGNFPANQTPPGYQADDYSNNIFNNELRVPEFAAYGDNEATQLSGHVAFGVDGGAVSQWISYAKGQQSKWDAQDASNPGQPHVADPPNVSSAQEVYVGPYNADLSGQPIDASHPPNAQQIKWLSQMVQTKPGLCYWQLNIDSGLMGACVGALPAMQSTYGHDIPSLSKPGSQLFSQADWAKATLLVAFEGKNPQNPDRDGKPAYNNSATINLTTGAPASGLGVYPSRAITGRVPSTPPNMPTIDYPLPLEGPGSIKQLINAVQPASCVGDTIAAIANRCKQIQPKTTDGEVSALLDAQLPMAPPNSPTWANAYKLYIYLPGGDLSAKLKIDTGPPPKLTGNAPDGCCGYPNTSNACYTNTYYLDGSVVDSQHDNNVHMRPYLEIDPQTPLNCIDHADWQPGSGADNNFGRMTFTEIGLGTTTFTHIN